MNRAVSKDPEIWAEITLGSSKAERVRLLSLRFLPAIDERVQFSAFICGSRY